MFELMTAVLPKISAGSPVCPYVGIYGFSAHALLAFLAKMPHYLGRRPLLFGYLFSDKFSQFDSQAAVILQSALSVIGFYLRLFTMVATLTTVAL